MTQVYDKYDDAPAAFTLDHPHGYKVRGLEDSEARIVSRDGPMPGFPVIAAWRNCRRSNWEVGFFDTKGCRSDSIGPHRGLINAPAPKRKVYMAMVRSYSTSYAPAPTHSAYKVDLENDPRRISPVVEVEIDV